MSTENLHLVDERRLQEHRPQRGITSAGWYLNDVAAELLNTGDVGNGTSAIALEHRPQRGITSAGWYLEAAYTEIDAECTVEQLSIARCRSIIGSSGRLTLKAASPQYSEDEMTHAKMGAPLDMYANGLGRDGPGVCNDIQGSSSEDGDLVPGGAGDWRCSRNVAEERQQKCCQLQMGGSRLQSASGRDGGSGSGEANRRKTELCVGGQDAGMESDAGLESDAPLERYALLVMDAPSRLRAKSAGSAMTDEKIPGGSLAVRQPNRIVVARELAPSTKERPKGFFLPARDCGMVLGVDLNGDASGSATGTQPTTRRPVGGRSSGIPAAAWHHLGRRHTHTLLLTQTWLATRYLEADVT